MFVHGYHSEVITGNQYHGTDSAKHSFIQGTHALRALVLCLAIPSSAVLIFCKRIIFFVRKMVLNLKSINRSLEAHTYRLAELSLQILKMFIINSNLDVAKKSVIHVFGCIAAINLLQSDFSLHRRI